MLGGADNPNGELLSYIIGADTNISIQRYSAWVCSRAMKNVQPAIAP